MLLIKSFLLTSLFGAIFFFILYFVQFLYSDSGKLFKRIIREKCESFASYHKYRIFLFYIRFSLDHSNSKYAVALARYSHPSFKDKNGNIIKNQNDIRNLALQCSLKISKCKSLRMGDRIEAAFTIIEKSDTHFKTKLKDICSLDPALRNSIRKQISKESSPYAESTLRAIQELCEIPDPDPESPS